MKICLAAELPSRTRCESVSVPQTSSNREGTGREKKEGKKGEGERKERELSTSSRPVYRMCSGGAIW